MALRSMMQRRAWLTWASASAITTASSAQGAKPIRIVVPFTPGGSTDILARVLAPHLSQLLGVQVIVDNKPGAGGTLGAADVAKSDADGRTLLMGHIGTLAVNPSLYPKLPYDPIKGFTPIAFVARVPNVLVASSASAFRSLEDVLTHARLHPGRLTFSSGGNGSAAHITFESLKLAASVFALHIPYRGTAPSITDVMAGQVDVTFTGTPAVLPHIKSGRLRALAVSSAERLAVLPDVPTVAERGLAGFEADQWYGLVAPVSTPSPSIAVLNAAVNAALARQEVLQQLALEGAEPSPSTPQVFGNLIAREIPRWARVVRAARITPG